MHCMLLDTVTCMQSIYELKYLVFRKISMSRLSYVLRSKCGSQNKNKVHAVQFLLIFYKIKVDISE